MASVLVLGFAGMPAALAVQPGVGDEVPGLTATDRAALGDEAVTAYLEALDLDGLLAEQLLMRVESAAGQERTRLAERLGRVYARLLERADTPQERERWEAHSRRLLDLVPEAETYELRINLARALYAGAEGVMERARLGLAEPAERTEAVDSLRQARIALLGVARRAHQRVESFERREERGDDDLELRDALSEARRLRSLAFYYAGWCSYYLGWGSGDLNAIRDAQEQFGWLLNSRSEAPSLERAPTGLFKYEHVARAAMGAGLCASLLGRDAEALAWFNLIEKEDDASPAVRGQLLGRRIGVLARAGRWADLVRLVERERETRPKPAEPAGVVPPRPGQGATAPTETAEATEGAEETGPWPLATVDARLLAIVALEADRRYAGDLLDRLARIAFADLVARGEIDHILDLVTRYGTAPLGEDGFIPNYVRGLQLYERAREAHEASDAEPDEPAPEGELAEAYSAAADQLRAAIDQGGDGTFGVQIARAEVQLGLALFFARRFEEAADRFETVSESGGSQGEEALWRAIISLDRAGAEPGTEAGNRLEQLAALYVQRYPESERAGRLILSGQASGLIDDQAAAEVLLGVPESSEVFASARRLAARLLYREYRRSRGSRRDVAMGRFLTLAEDVLAMERAEAESDAPVESRVAAERGVVLARQILDAALGSDAPDVQRAERALRSIDRMVALHGLDTSGLRDELLFRRMQIALARGDDDEAGRLGEQLRTIGGRYAASSERLVFRSAVRAWRRRPTDVEAGERVVRIGQRLAASIEAASSPADSTRLSVLDDVAEAAFAAWRAGHDESMRDAALEADREILRVRSASRSSLERVAVAAEDAGQVDEALKAWRTLMLGREGGGQAWYEARYHSLRLLAETDPREALRVYEQHAVLNPSIGPEPWGEKLRAIGRELRATVGGDESPAEGGEGGS